MSWFNKDREKAQEEEYVRQRQEYDRREAEREEKEAAEMQKQLEEAFAPLSKEERWIIRRNVATNYMGYHYGLRRQIEMDRLCLEIARYTVTGRAF